MADDYEVGFRKPPKSGRFRKGKSGNPKGRPKESRDLKSDLQDELQSTVSVSEGGRKRKMSRQRALIKRVATSALSGDYKSTALLFQLASQLERNGPNEAGETPGEEEDRQILERFARQLRAEKSKSRREKDDHEPD